MMGDGSPKQDLPVFEHCVSAADFDRVKKGAAACFGEVGPARQDAERSRSSAPDPMSRRRRGRDASPPLVVATPTHIVRQRCHAITGGWQVGWWRLAGGQLLGKQKWESSCMCDAPEGDYAPVSEFWDMRWIFGTPAGARRFHADMLEGARANGNNGRLSAREPRPPGRAGLELFRGHARSTQATSTRSASSVPKSSSRPRKQKSRRAARPPSFVRTSRSTRRATQGGTQTPCCLHSRCAARDEGRLPRRRHQRFGPPQDFCQQFSCTFVRGRAVVKLYVICGMDAPRAVDAASFVQLMEKACDVIDAGFASLTHEGPTAGLIVARRDADADARACHACGAAGAKHQCSRCRVARYCSKACAVHAWKNLGHKLECKPVQA